MRRPIISKGPTRRQVLAGAGAMAAGLMRNVHAASAASVAPITIVINQSPWFESFSKTVELYEKETGNKVELDVNPFAGSLEKQRNSVRSSRGQYDILMMNGGWFSEMYFGGFVEAISDIDPSFKLEPDVFTLGDSVYFDPIKKVMNPRGKLMSLPIAPLIPLLFYRGDLYKDAGLKAPASFAELETNAKLLNKPPGRYGIVQRGARGPYTVSFDFFPYLYGSGGSVFKDQAAGDYSVTLNNEAGRAALEYWLRLAKEAGHPQSASLDQAEVIQNMLSGKAAHIMVVVSAWSQMDDPEKSAVVDKVEYAPTPHGNGLPSKSVVAQWLGGVAKNVPDDRKRAAVEFLRWFQTTEAQLAYAKAGGIPIRKATYDNPIAQERKYRWMKPLVDSLPQSVNVFQFPEASEVIAILELGLNLAIAGNADAVSTLNNMSSQIYDVVSKYGYKTAQLTPLR